MKNYYLQFKKQLEKLKGEIERRLKGLERIPELGEDADPDTETQESEEYGKQLSIAQVLKNQLVAINNSLLKFGQKKYGICERCGKEISADLLKVVPESKLCKECKRSL